MILKAKDKLNELIRALSKRDAIKYLFSGEIDDGHFFEAFASFGVENVTKAVLENKDAVSSSLLKIYEEKVDKLKSETVTALADEIIKLDEIRVSLQAGDFKELTWEKLHGE